MGNPNCKIKLIYTPHSLPAYDRDGLIFKLQETLFSSAIPVLFNNPVLDEVRKATRMPATPTQVRNFTGRRLAEVNIQQPEGIGHPGHEAAADELVRTVKLMSEVKVVRRWPRSGLKTEILAVMPGAGVKPGKIADVRIVAIGASTGGPLSGMGQDGAMELKLLKEKGAITIAQDKESYVVHGMPGQAIKLDAATYVLSPEGIATALIDIVDKEKRR